MFKEIDPDHDGRLTLEEFKLAIPHIEKWGVKISDPE